MVSTAGKYARSKKRESAFYGDDEEEADGAAALDEVLAAETDDDEDEAPETPAAQRSATAGLARRGGLVERFVHGEPVWSKADRTFEVVLRVPVAHRKQLIVSMVEQLAETLVVKEVKGIKKCNTVEVDGNWMIQTDGVNLAAVRG